ncbi:MAG TPA: ATP-binding protein [Taishania sp.]|nr:ATP-binding protein [Taishania sp.]HNS41453.1 ATP-binding protein [Taishania sp.]
MKFYNRENELAELSRIQQLAFTDCSRLTVITGRRRIGKTSLILKATASTPTVYLFVGRKNEAALCAEFSQIITQSLDVFIPSEIKTFRSLFQTLLEVAKTKSFTLVIDEFQEFYTINSSIYSDIQHIWDLYRKETKMNFIVSGSIYSLMQQLFLNNKEPLFGRADNILKLKPFDLVTLKQIISDYYPTYTNDDLLALYAFTGGVPKYVELLCDNQKLSVNEMIAFMVRDNSLFTEEGRYLLIEEFGKNYGTYFSILAAISSGINTQSEIEAKLGDKNLGGHLKRLIEDYNIIRRVRPILAKEGTLAVRYEIEDHFLKFWFNYFERNRSMVEIKNFGALQNLILDNYPTYSGIMLERYFTQQFIESGNYRAIGSWWELKGNQHEIDIVALKLEKNKAIAVEVKRQRKNFKPEIFAEKVAYLKNKHLNNYDIEQICLTLEDM